MPPLKLSPAAAVLTCLLAPVAVGDVAQVYFSRGVEAYQDENWARAEDYFGRAATYAPGDPRPYYFRGAARIQRGREIEGDSDLRQGAILEAGKGRVFPLGSALANLSGPARTRLDQVRTEMLSGLPAYADGEGLPGGSRRAARALRPKFTLSISQLTSIESPAELAKLVEAKRAQSLEMPSKPVVAAAPPASNDVDLPEAARGSMTAGEVGGVFVRALMSFGGLAGGDGDGGANGAFGGSGDGGDPFGAPSGGDPFGDAPAGGDPFGQAAGGDPFADDPMSQGPAEIDDGEFGDDPFADDPFGGGASEDPFQ
ncbi:MAG: hypothetical protein AAGJ46_02205 [Planctomycetota bacterium]